MPTVPAIPCASTRVQSILEKMTLEQKISQLISYWIDQPDDGVAPLQEEMVKEDEYKDTSQNGLGHLTRVYGTTPVEPAERAQWLAEEQLRLKERSGLGIGAIVHEECLTGLAAWQATAFPCPLAWGATFDPVLVEKMGQVIGEDMAALGIHQGLAPVLDVIRDLRWGRTEEAISEDPYLVGTIATAYIEGLQSAGVDATLKHFVGYSNSRAGRNHAPVSIGPRELFDVFIPPFEMAIFEGKARSVMNSYAELDGIPVAADSRLLTDLLRERWGFEGPVVADYYTVAFLEMMHRVAGDKTQAATLALRAGIDVELPMADAYPGLKEAVRSGKVSEQYIDRAVLRILSQKERHGLLDASEWIPPEAIDLDSPRNRLIAREIAEASVVLLANNLMLPLNNPRSIAVVGPNGNAAEPLMGCYSFVNHVLAHHPGVEHGIEIPTVYQALTQEFPETDVSFIAGCAVEDEPDSLVDGSDIARAAEVASAAEVIVAAVGDRAGLFGRGTVGEGNDVESLDLPGRQRQLVEALIATGKPVILLLLTGRPYTLSWALDGPNPPAAVLQAFFPGEEGSTAVARILSGKVSPSGRLPISLPRSAGSQPYTYMHPLLGGPSDVTCLNNDPVRPFGFGMTYTTFRHLDLKADKTVAAGETLEVEVTVVNTGDSSGTDVVQLYGRDMVASVTRPVAQLLAYHRVSIAPGESQSIKFKIPASRLSFVDQHLDRVVEPGLVELWVGESCADKETSVSIEVVGSTYQVKLEDPRRVEVESL